MKVRYIDFGNCEVVDQNSLVVLPASLADIVPCAKEYDLGIKPITLDENSEKFEQVSGVYFAFSIDSNIGKFVFCIIYVTWKLHRVYCLL